MSKSTDEDSKSKSKVSAKNDKDSKMPDTDNNKTIKGTNKVDDRYS